MIYFNDYDVLQARAQVGHLPNLGAAVTTLENLIEWTNNNSDGWAHWPKPCRAAAKLQELIQDGQARLRSSTTFRSLDCTCDELRTALTPIKAFRTRQHADFVCEVGTP